MPTEEALDLIRCLPDGSLYKGAVWPSRSWDAVRQDLADIKDLLYVLAWARGVYGELEQPPSVTRPADVAARKVAQERRRSVMETINSTRWKAVDNG